MKLSASLEQVILGAYQDLDTSLSLKCAILWRYGEWEALLDIDCRPEDSDTALKCLLNAQCVALTKKLKGLLANDQQRSDRARQKWMEGEAACYETNLRLKGYLLENQAPNPEIAQHLAGVSQVVEELIGKGPPDDLLGRLGPGATFFDRGTRTTVLHKFSSDPTLTPNSVFHLFPFFGTAWGKYTADREGKLVFIRGNRFTTVPKTSKTDRAIAVEPSINVFFQLAAGTALRRRLRRRNGHGWDLDHAQEIHRRVAAESSVSREFATLDLSNASDTVAYNLVKLLLPRKWFELLDSLRSPYTLLPGRILKDQKSEQTQVRLEKFSSMGNGYTFELETVLFAAMCIYCTRRVGGAGVLGWDVFVFGDDIIIRDEVVQDVKAVLTYCGLQLNDQKSFSGMSPFRESCGADFYVGANVRPAYLKEEPQDVKALLGVYNRLATAHKRISLLGGSFGRRSRHVALCGIPTQYRLFGPEGLGDSVLWDPHWEQRAKVRWRHSIRYVKGVKPCSDTMRIVQFRKFDPRAVLASALYGCGNVGTPEGGRVPLIEGVVPRDPIRSYVTGWFACS